MRPEELTLEKEGAQLFSIGLSMAQLSELENARGAQPRDHARVRLSAIHELRPFLNPAGLVGQILASNLGRDCLPVRAMLFDKSAHKWSLGCHQDRTIAVEQRIDVDGFGPRSIKGGMVHAEPPFGLLSSLVTVRVHLELCASYKMHRC